MRFDVGSLRFSIYCAKHQTEIIKQCRRNDGKLHEPQEQLCIVYATQNRTFARSTGPGRLANVSSSGLASSGASAASRSFRLPSSWSNAAFVSSIPIV